MNHPAELMVYSFLQKAMAGEASMTEEVAAQVASDVQAAMHKQFNSGPRDEFRLRMSNIGKPKCQLWFEKNDPEDKTPLPPHFLMNMILGDIVEAVFKGLLRAAGVEFKDNDTVILKLANGKEIKGEYDMEMDGKIEASLGDKVDIIEGDNEMLKDFIELIEYSNGKIFDLHHERAKGHTDEDEGLVQDILNNDFVDVDAD